MSKGSHKITGFLWALILAIVSFFVIFLFFPDVSYKFFGVSVKQPVGKTVSEAAEKVADKVNESIDGAISDAAEKIVDKTVETFDNALDSVSNITTK